MYKTMNNKKFLLSVFALILSVLLAGVLCYTYLNVVAIDMSATANAEDFSRSIDGIEVVSGTKTMYYLDIPCKGTVGYCDMYPSDEVVDANRIFNEYYDSIAAAKTPVTFLFIFNNVKVNGRPLLATWNLPIDFYHGNGDRTGAIYKWAYRNNGKTVKLAQITFADDARINIRKEYYDKFKDADFSDISITHLYNGKGYIMYNSHTADLEFGDPYFDYNNKTVLYHNFENITLRDETVSSDYDPSIDEGQAPDNGGVVDSPVVSWFEKLGFNGDFLSWVKGIMAKLFDISVENIPDWAAILFIVGIVVISVPLVVLIIRFFPWIVKGVVFLFKGLFYVLSLPVRGIIALIRRIRGEN